MSGALIPISILSLVIILAFAFVMFKMIKGNVNKATTYESIVIENNKLRVNVLVSPPEYDILEIDYVKFWKTYRRSNHVGWYRIYLKNNRKSRPFMFDGGVYSGRMHWVNSSDDISKSTEKLVQILEKHGIKYIIQ